MRKHCYARDAVVLSAVLTILVAGLAGCSSSATASSPATSGPVWGFPFQAGTQVKLGEFGLHDDNYHGLSDYNLSNAALADSALDIVPIDQSAPTPVIPVASGTILAVAPACHFVLIDHGNGVWVGYQHLDLSPTLGVHSHVDRSTILGYTAAAPINSPNCEYSTARHVHFAFLTGDDKAQTGPFVTMVGRMLCGHKVTKSTPVAPIANDPEGGAIEGLASGPGQSFTVPPESQCARGGGATPQAKATPTPHALTGTIKEFLLPTQQTFSYPSGLIVGPDGNLWFSESTSSGRIGRITPSGTITEFSVPAPQSEPGGLVVGPDGNLWFTEGAGTGDPRLSAIGRITPNGVITEFPTPTSLQSPLGLVVGRDGNLWFSASSAIGRITPSGIFSEFPTPTPLNGPDDLVVGSDGNLWFTEQPTNQNGGAIGRITPSGAITEFPTPTPQSGPHSLVVGPDGNLWFAEYYTSNNSSDRDACGIGRITPSGAITEFLILPLPAGQNPPEGLVVGPDGNLWYTQNNNIGRITPNGAITVFPLPTSDGYPSGLVVGPDSNLWFTEPVANRIAHITPSGAITEFSIPTPRSYPSGLVVGPDGNLWFTVGDVTDGTSPSAIGRLS